MCGEQTTSCRQDRGTMGSSPRVRGTAFFISSSPCCSRIIPACAGNSLYEAMTPTGGKDHPRVCGEQSSPSPHWCCCLGSSPRVRGTVHDIRHTHCSLRIIPACAGNSLCLSCDHRDGGDHPRVCGEQAFDDVISEEIRGSSPRVRGTGCYHDLSEALNGIIPACAGNS